ncbi:hypothetical protein [uncultured Cohaesibacter sp.]|uniref:hypothetical protein n=1 Tax=uncultured Cohaesibacter sp. TaxID=1002546 RepID=UPI0029307C68|nr:hypothetical protein [uncultured Cohaesibacter sp.]
MADIKVKALKRGQKPNRRWAKEGEVFTIDEDKFSSGWMVKVEQEATASATDKEAENAEKDTLIAQLAELGIEKDRRSSIESLKEALEEATEPE